MNVVARLVLSTSGVVFVAELPDRTALAQDEVRRGSPDPYYVATRNFVGSPPS